MNTLNDRLSGAHVGVSRPRPAAAPRPVSRPRPRPVVPSRPRAQPAPSRDLGDPCRPSPCGENTSCTSRLNRAVCSCLPNHTGNPDRGCRPDGCKSNPCGRDAECISQGPR